MSDQMTEHFRQQLADAHADQRLLCIDGNQSKSFYGFPLEGEVISTRQHKGIISYSPTELVITARAGTLLSDMQDKLNQHRQMLACEPPHFGAATLGGMLASGLSGPGSYYAGGIADQVLGCTIMNSRGQVLRFGGKVMKNVAGFDLSRLMVGSMGCLGIILDATLKLTPRPESEITYRFQLEPEKSAGFVNQLRNHSLPVTASSHNDECLRVRFSAGAQEIRQLNQQLDSVAGFVSREIEDYSEYWEHLREQTLPFFVTDRNLWRITCPPAAKRLPLPGKTLYEWNGALRWYITDASSDEVFAAAESIGGSASLFRAGSYQTGINARFQPMSPALMQWHKAIKLAFDPEQLMNTGRMYPEL